MADEHLKPFRLVGGTALSLQCGHRISIDIDLFTDSAYNSINFEYIDERIKAMFPYTETAYVGNRSMGKSYYVGEDSANLVKLDFYYTDTYVFPELEIEGIRMASIEEIAAMKMEVIGHGGRKKDFWDIHELLDSISIHQIFNYYFQRYPYGHSKMQLIENLTNFEQADEDFDPICLRQKYWELIKLDLSELSERAFK